MKIFENYLLEKTFLNEEFKVPALLKKLLPNYNIRIFAKLIMKHSEYNNIDWQKVEVKKRKIYDDLDYLKRKDKLFIYTISSDIEMTPTIFNIYTRKEVQLPKCGAFVGGDLWDLTKESPMKITTLEYLKKYFSSLGKMFKLSKIENIFELTLKELDITQGNTQDWKDHTNTRDYITTTFVNEVKNDVDLLFKTLDTLVFPEMKGVSVHDIRYVLSKEYRKNATNPPSKEIENKIKQVYNSALPKTKKCKAVIKRILDKVEDTIKYNKQSYGSGIKSIIYTTFYDDLDFKKRFMDFYFDNKYAFISYDGYKHETLDERLLYNYISIQLEQMYKNPFTFFEGEQYKELVNSTRQWFKNQGSDSIDAAIASDPTYNPTFGT